MQESIEKKSLPKSKQRCWAQKRFGYYRKQHYFRRWVNHWRLESCFVSFAGPNLSHTKKKQRKLINSVIMNFFFGKNTSCSVVFHIKVSKDRFRISPWKTYCVDAKNHVASCIIFEMPISTKTDNDSTTSGRKNHKMKHCNSWERKTKIISRFKKGTCWIVYKLDSFRKGERRIIPLKFILINHPDCISKGGIVDESHSFP